MISALATFALFDNIRIYTEISRFLYKILSRKRLLKFGNLLNLSIRNCLLFFRSAYHL